MEGVADRKVIARQFNNINNRTTRTADDKEKENLQYCINSPTRSAHQVHINKLKKKCLNYAP